MNKFYRVYMTQTEYEDVEAKAIFTENGNLHLMRSENVNIESYNGFDLIDTNAVVIYAAGVWYKVVEVREEEKE